MASDETLTHISVGDLTRCVEALRAARSGRAEGTHERLVLHSRDWREPTLEFECHELLFVVIKSHSRRLDLAQNTRYNHGTPNHGLSE